MSTTSGPLCRESPGISPTPRAPPCRRAMIASTLPHSGLRSGGPAAPLQDRVQSSSSESALLARGGVCDCLRRGRSCELAAHMGVFLFGGMTSCRPMRGTSRQRAEPTPDMSSAPHAQVKGKCCQHLEHVSQAEEHNFVKGAVPKDYTSNSLGKAKACLSSKGHGGKAGD